MLLFDDVELLLTSASRQSLPIRRVGHETREDAAVVGGSAGHARDSAGAICKRSGEGAVRGINTTRLPVAISAPRTFGLMQLMPSKISVPTFGPWNQPHRFPILWLFVCVFFCLLDSSLRGLSAWWTMRDEAMMIPGDMVWWWDSYLPGIFGRY
ncbi:hypothetical protein HDK90DRAFT_490429 [Phyllosticta capitalensis]|uniref:Uncharacterized protein n=1 Tax=Phyllosticta capitalensis TaxID=121624 RepID=A0ABR1YLB5_9PEZI